MLPRLVVGTSLFLIGALLHPRLVKGQACSEDVPCATGCCANYGICGLGKEFCAPGNCVNNCDYNLECDDNNPCVIGCCSKSGYCGLGPDFCSSENCINSCDAKGECDPDDWGLDYVTAKTCPLNVCCSDFGFCGTTEEFCGNTKVKRPSCDADHSTYKQARVVGYYEGWAPSRRCKDFWPEQVPVGYYTHLNYAFGTVDPDTFEVNLASKDEFEILERLTALKDYDPDLKIFIALGGWTYNDPGPTQSTFSDLAKSDDAQKKFFKSLISFLSTWNLDGVDIDWEYPGSDDIVERGGREEDFENFPNFLKALKAALKSAGGGRDGLTITLPASYWYMQYFDIKELEKHVDWFNMMSYDIHGSWDRFNKWTGAFLNSHTNLTEIKDAFDLLWRNDIPSNKVVMGMAFYGRAFTATMSDCLTPGCLFESAGYQGACSRENGILMNSEIVELIEQKGLKPTLYKDAAVKAISWDDQWVTYDDEDTFQLKLDFVASECLGGVMVWAVSHDTADGNFTHALGKYTGRTDASLAHDVDSDSDYVEVKQYIDQCKWTNCGETCPSGFSAVQRDDKWRHSKGELMMDGNGCDGNGIHTLCCPSGEMPSCGWYSHNNGKCKSECPSGYIEIGSTRDGCKKSSEYQAACCTVDKKSMDLWNTCDWAGTPPDSCDDTCPPINIWELHSSPQGSGGVKCSDDDERKYCCDRTYDQKKWGDCTLEKFWGIFVQDTTNPDYCAAACPGDQYRINLENTDVCDGVPGAAAYCCDSGYYDVVEKEDPDVTDLKDALKNFVDNPLCLSEWNDPLTGSLAARDLSKNQGAKKFVWYFAYALGALYNTFEVQKAIVYVNDALDGKFDNLKFPDIKTFLEDFYPNYYRVDPDVIAEDIACNLERWDDLASDDPVLSCPPTVCDIRSGACDEDKIDPDEACFETSTSLSERADRQTSGASRWYCIRLSRTDTSDYNNVRSSRYNSNGDWLEGDAPRTRGVVLRNHGDCTSPSIEIVLIPVDGYSVQYRGEEVIIATHTEHLVEQNTLATFASDAVLGQLSNRQEDQNAFTAVPRGFFAQEFFDHANVPYGIWGRPPGGRRTSIPYRRVFEAFGSEHNIDCFYLLDAYINGVKSQVWRWRDGELLPDDVMGDALILPYSWQSLHELRIAMTVFTYLNHNEVHDCLVKICNDIRDQLRTANRAWNVANPTQTFDIRPIWDRWIRNHFTQMASYTRTRMRYWLDEVDERWDGVDSTMATRSRQDAQRIRDSIDTVVTVNVNGLDSATSQDDANDPPLATEATDIEE